VEIGLLGCDDVASRLRNIAGGYRDMFHALLAPVLPDAAFRWFDVHAGELPASAIDCDAWLCTGSRYSVYEQRDWIEALKRFVREVHEARKPFVGICFGHQMLAQALGGSVTRAPQGWGIGVHEMTIERRESWMEPARTRCRLQYMHADQVQALPPGSVVLGRSEHCDIGMFRVGETMLGIEGHPEFPAAYERALLLHRRERIGEALVDEALATVDDPTDEDVVARWIANFIERR
jgi:GMP synthase-like glutamine amidotransferase